MSSDEKVLDAEHIDRVRSVSDSDDSYGFSPAEQKSIVRRIDRRLVVTVGAMYCISLMDRTNMGAAVIAGMDKELQLIGTRYNIANLVFFITYIIFQPPSTVICRAVGPRVHLALITLLWGAVTISMGFVKDFNALAGLRALLGVFEAGFFPSCVYLLSTWYTRYEVGKRYSVFYIIGCLSSACSGILAGGLMKLNGKAGLTGWRWIFLVQGLITVTLAIASYWLLVDFPDSKRKTWSFLGQRERNWIVEKIQRDRGDTVVPKFNLKSFLKGGADWKIWVYAMIFCNTTTISYALAYTLPLILVNSLKFEPFTAQCLVAPPYAVAGFFIFLGGYLGDKYKVRGPIIIGMMVLCLIGLPIMGWHPNPSIRYFGVFLVTSGANANVPAVMSFQANNVRGQWKRAFCSATLVGFGGIGGIIGSLVFRKQDALTGYKPGMYTCIACAMLNIILVSICSLTFHFENKKADRGEKALESHEDGGAADFRYTY